MNTDDLIRTLAADTLPERRLTRGLWQVFVPAVAVSLAGVLLVLGVRPDLAAALENPVSLLRFVLAGGLAAAGLWLVLRLARPEPLALLRYWPVGTVGLAAAGLWLWAFVTTPAGAQATMIAGSTISQCLTAIPLLSVPMVAALFALLRRGAVTAPARAGAIAGLAGSAMAATLYALHCIEDNPLFYITWYGLAICMVTLASGVIGSRFLRW